MGSSGVAPLNGCNHFVLQILGAPVEACAGAVRAAAMARHAPCSVWVPKAVSPYAAWAYSGSGRRSGLAVEAGHSCPKRVCPTSGGRVVVQRRVRPVRAVVIGVLIEDRPADAVRR